MRMSSLIMVGLSKKSTTMNGLDGTILAGFKVGLDLDHSVKYLIKIMKLLSIYYLMNICDQHNILFNFVAGMFNREFREGQQKGLPYPILWIAEYFVLDGEGVRWGRHYRQAGYYSHIMMW